MASRSFDPHRNDPQGSVIVFVLITVTVLLTFAGIAIDIGNLHRAQLAAQNSADATALAIVNHITMRGKFAVEQAAFGTESISPSDTVVATRVDAYLRPQIEHLARANMETQGFPHAPTVEPGPDRSVGVTSSYRTRGLLDPSVRDGRSFEYEVNVERRVDFLFITPFVSWNYSTVRARAVAVRNVADVILVLDVSGSLRCPNSGPCDCLDPTKSIDCPVDDNRFASMVDGVKNFLRLFDLEKDRISFVPFNLAARRFTMEDFRSYVGLSGPLSATQIELIGDFILAEFVSGNGTNLCDGLMEALAEMEERSPPAERPSYVVFTDGAPTAGRFLFTDAAAGGRLDVNDLGFGRYDYDTYTLAWMEDPTNSRPTPAATPDPRIYSGPSLLVDSSALRSGVDGEIGTPLDNPASLPPSIIATVPNGPRCDNGKNRATPVSASSSIRDASTENFDGCLNSYEAHMPGNPSSVFGRDYGPTKNPPKYADMRYQYYHCAIQLADYIRESAMGTIYVVGLGDRNTTAAANDPYQSIDDESGRKDVLLSRIAMDLEQSNVLRYNDGTGLRRLRFDYSEYRDIAELSGNNQRRAGIYLPTSDPTQLRLLFQHIGRKILLKMVS